MRPLLVFLRSTCRKCVSEGGSDAGTFSNHIHICTTCIIQLHTCTCTCIIHVGE